MNGMKGLSYNVHSSLHQKRDDDDGSGGKPLPHKWLRCPRRIEFLDPSERTALEDFYARGLCSWREATAANCEVLKQGLSPAPLVRQILPLTKPKGKTTIRKARKMKALPGVR